MAITATDARVVDLVREQLHELGMTQAALAGALGLSPMSISDRMNGRSRFTVDEVARLARILGLDLHALLGEEAAA